MWIKTNIREIGRLLLRIFEHPVAQDLIRQGIIGDLSIKLPMLYICTMRPFFFLSAKKLPRIMASAFSGSLSPSYCSMDMKSLKKKLS
jgi:hypothetical protein